MELRKIYKRMLTVVWIGLALVLTGAFVGIFVQGSLPTLVVSLTLLFAGCIVVIAAAIYSFLRLRCPHCNTLLYFRGSKPNFCPECGKKLEW